MLRFLSLLFKPLLGLLWIAMASMAMAVPGELLLVSEPSMKGVLTAAAVAFEKDSGIHVGLLFVKTNQLNSVIDGMDHPDLAVLPDEIMDKMVKAGHLQVDSRQPFGQVGLAVVVKKGSAVPDVSTPAALKQVLSQAKSITYGQPGEHLAGRQAAELINRMGLVEELKDRIMLASGANPLARVSLGAAEVGIHSLHEAQETDGVVVAGPVPAPLQSSLRYAMALTAHASNVDEANRLMSFLSSGAGRRLLESRGFMAP